MTDDAHELARRLARSLEHLQLIRECAARLFARDQLGRDFFARGQDRPRRKPNEAELEEMIDGMRRVQFRQHHGTAVAEERRE